MRPLAIGLLLLAALTMAGCATTYAPHRAPEPVARPAPPPVPSPYDSLKVDQVAGPDAESVVIDVRPVTLKKVPPEYPDAARSAGAQGTVRVQALIGTEGRVEDTRMVQSIPLLDEAAMAAI